MKSRDKEKALQLYFDKGMSPEDIAEELDATQTEIDALLGDERALSRYRKRVEAAKLRAQICLSESAEEAARRQAELLRSDETKDSRSISQRAAKDILDRAGIRGPKENKQDITITFAEGMPKLGMPKRE